MEIQPRSIKSPRLRTSELVTLNEESNSELEFDPETEIPKKIWAMLGQWLQLKNPVGEEPRKIQLLLLAQLDPGRLATARAKPGLEDALVQRWVGEYGKDSGSSAQSGFLLLKKISEFNFIFPEIAEKVELVAGQSLDIYYNRSWAGQDADFSHEGYKTFIQLFPDKRPVLVQLMTRKQSLPDRLLELEKLLPKNSARALEVAPGLAANLELIFPDHKAEIHELIQPYWDDLKQRQQAIALELSRLGDMAAYSAPTEFDTYIENAIYLSILAAQQVRFTPDHQLEIIPKTRSPLRQRPNLPQRSV